MGILINSSDATKEQLELALRESEEKYRNLVERAGDGVAIIQDGLVTYANPRLAEMWQGSVEWAAFLPKPFDPMELARKVRHLLDG